MYKRVQTFFLATHPVPDTARRFRGTALCAAALPVTSALASGPAATSGSSQSMVMSALLIGSGATLVMDIWLHLLRQFGVQGLNVALLGRWAGHLLRGRFRHTAIASAAPVDHETALGWLLHYLTGIVFAAALLGFTDSGWLPAPTLWPALLFGVVTVLIPLGLMQPSMGAGWFARRTATPMANCLRSLINHSVFGFGLYLSASLLALFTR